MTSSVDTTEMSFCVPDRVSRRNFLRRLSGGAALAFAGASRRPAPAIAKGAVRVARVVVFRNKGRRLTPVAPNAYAPYRGYEVQEPLVKLQTDHGLEGIGWDHEGVGRELLGRDPVKLFEWEGDRIVGPREETRDLLLSLRGTDIALLDLVGRILHKPIAELLGPPVRQRVRVYDSSLYQEDLLTKGQAQSLAYLSTPVTKPEEMVACKAQWILQRGFNVMKIKIGRGKWISDWQQALERDTAVVEAVRRAVGPNPTLFVDANNGYDDHREDVRAFLKATKSASLLAIEEMYNERILEPRRELRKTLDASGIRVKIADGESAGLPEELLKTGLFDLNQPDMAFLGFLRMMEAARISQMYRVNLAPHNFGTKMGLFAQAHLGAVVPNFEFAEADDSEFPAYQSEGILFEDGQVRLAGLPGLGVRLIESKLGEPLRVYS